MGRTAINFARCDHHAYYVQTLAHTCSGLASERPGISHLLVIIACILSLMDI